VEWAWVDPCDAGGSGDIVVTITATDGDTPDGQLIYSNGPWLPQELGCGDINAAQTTLTCPAHAGARSAEAIVTDPQGNEDKLSFNFDPCTNGCEGDACPL